jgi:hypothetical protein
MDTCAVCANPAHKPGTFARTYQGHQYTTQPYPGQLTKAAVQADELADHMTGVHGWTIFDHERDDADILTAMHQVAVENNPGSCDQVHLHNWIVLVAEHGPDSPYGCQACPARAIGSEIGVECRDCLHGLPCNRHTA